MESIATNSASKKPPVERLLASAQTAAIELGLAGVSARSIGARAGLAASAISYHFRRVEDLLRVALDQARERDLIWRGSIIDGLRRESLDASLFPHFFHGIVDEAARTQHPLTLLRWDVALEAALHRRFVPLAHRWRDDLESFWSMVLKIFGMSAPAQLVAEFADAASRIHMAAGASATHIAWVAETCERFALRLCDQRPPRRQGQLWRDLHRAAARLTPPATHSQQVSETARRIVEGAIAVLHARGPGALTHRAVATAAGVSLSSTTYHFANRGDIVLAAFTALRAVSIERVRKFDAPARSLSIDELLKRMGAALVPGRDSVSRDYLSGQSLLHAAARDPALREHAQDIYAHMGEPTMRLFELTPELRDEADPLTAFIFALWTDAMLLNACLEEHRTRAPYVLTSQRAMLRILLGG